MPLPNVRISIHGKGAVMKLHECLLAHAPAYFEFLREGSSRGLHAIRALLMWLRQSTQHIQHSASEMISSSAHEEATRLQTNAEALETLVQHTVRAAGATQRAKVLSRRFPDIPHRWAGGRAGACAARMTESARRA